MHRSNRASPSQLPRILLLALALTGTAVQAHEDGRPQHSPGKPYAARNLPDRIVLTPGADPATEMAVAWRTDTRQKTAIAQLAPGLAGPSLEAAARRVEGGPGRELKTENGRANYHQVRFKDLSPGQVYAYRVQGSAGWSEWHSFRTAERGFAPFRFLYFGDTQNDILSLGARVIRQAVMDTAAPALMVHAGDLVAQRESMVHDDEWGEWTQAGAFSFASIPQLPAAGNHEYVDVPGPKGEESRKLGPHWELQFALPDNGVEPVRRTTYYVDYQDTRFVVLDGTAALDLDAAESQTRWLERVLKDRPTRWAVALFHQPIYTCARPKDTEVLKAAWMPLLERYRVDLVLQGHDHCYSRISHPAGAAAGREQRAAGATQGPVYIVSVTGSKMYGLNDRAAVQPDRVAEDTELFQVIEVEAAQLRYRSYAANGRLYDAFDLLRDQDGHNRLQEYTASLPARRVCTDGQGPDALPCTTRSK